VSTCPECFDDVGCTCKQDKRIAELEADAKMLDWLLDNATSRPGTACLYRLPNGDECPMFSREDILTRMRTEATGGGDK
jgi:hypothetical protein